jgi:hypothetical protein
MRKAPLLHVTAQLAIGFRGTKLGGSAFDKSDGEFPSSPSPSGSPSKASRNSGAFRFPDKRGEVGPSSPDARYNQKANHNDRTRQYRPPTLARTSGAVA